MKAMVLPESGVNALCHLAEYRFLTASKLVHLGGVRASPRSANNLLRQLEQDYRLVDKVAFGVHPTQGRLESVYFLTPKGAVMLEQEFGLAPQAIKYPKSAGTIFQRDYFHRMTCLDFEICFKTWLKAQGFECRMYDRYFDPASDGTAKPSRPKTLIPLAKGRVIIPDAVAVYHARDRDFLFLAEISMGIEAKRVVQQIEAHVVALGTGSPSAHCNVTYGHFVVCLFEAESCMRAVMRHMASDAALHESLKRHFLFGLIEAAKGPFEEIAWRLWDGERLDFYGA